MKRRNFFKKLGIGVTALVVAPKILVEVIGEEEVIQINEITEIPPEWVNKYRTPIGSKLTDGKEVLIYDESTEWMPTNSASVNLKGNHLDLMELLSYRRSRKYNYKLK